jgi:hypothetical protein
MFKKLYLINESDLEILRAKSKPKILDYNDIYDSIIACKEEIKEEGKEEKGRGQETSINKWEKYQWKKSKNGEDFKT